MMSKALRAFWQWVDQVSRLRPGFLLEMSLARSEDRRPKK
jgi:hypothetical protein